MKELTSYLNSMIPGIHMILKWIFVFFICITILKYIKSKIPRIKKQNKNWGLTEDEIKYIYDSQKEENQ